jgi:DNA segregation ATPase FtsK/SpoIIIE-like protein
MDQEYCKASMQNRIGQQVNKFNDDILVPMSPAALKCPACGANVNLQDPLCGYCGCAVVPSASLMPQPINVTHITVSIGRRASVHMKTEEPSISEEDAAAVLYESAVRIVLQEDKASVSLLQRKLNLGYGRAARIIDRMEEEGIVGPDQGAGKPRVILAKPPRT